MTKARTLADNFAADISGVTAGTGITGGGTSGTVTITNSMATEITAKGDLIVGTGNATFDNLPAGSAGETLVVDSAATVGLRWQGNYSAGKNKIINGNMVIDQRNTASTAVTVNTTGTTYAVDRWLGFGQTADGVYTLAQDSSAPAGFTKSLKATVTTADTSIASTQSYTVSQRIEGFNVADLDFGLSSAKTITVSFWVRSSLTGTFGATLRNSAVDRSYPYSYTISTADTWEKKTVTIAGDTTGTWLKDSNIGLRIDFSLGAGTDRLGTAGAWNGNNNIGVTGQTQVIETLNATWYITGVQVEIGNVATAFQTATGTLQGELAACQRYFYQINGNDGGGTQVALITGTYTGTTAIKGFFPFPVKMRTAPSVTSSNSASYFAIGGGGGGNADTVGSIQYVGTTGCSMNFTASASSTIGYSCIVLTNNASAYVALSAEL